MPSKDISHVTFEIYRCASKIIQHFPISMQIHVKKNGDEKKLHSMLSIERLTNLTKTCNAFEKKKKINRTLLLLPSKSSSLKCPDKFAYFFSQHRIFSTIHALWLTPPIYANSCYCLCLFIVSCIFFVLSRFDAVSFGAFNKTIIHILR